MGRECPGCGEKFGHEVRYCSECGDVVDIDTQVAEDTSKPDFWAEHKGMILSVGTFLLIYFILRRPELLTGGLEGIIRLTVVSAAALLGSYGLVYVGSLVLNRASTY